MIFMERKRNREKERKSENEKFERGNLRLRKEKCHEMLIFVTKFQRELARIERKLKKDRSFKGQCGIKASIRISGEDECISTNKNQGKEERENWLFQGATLKVSFVCFFINPSAENQQILNPEEGFEGEGR